MKRFHIRLKQLTATLIFGLPVTVWLLLRDRKTVYFIPHVGLGDYCIALGYLGAYKRQNNISHITLVIPPNRREIAQFYFDWDSLLVLSPLFYKAIVYFGSIPVGRSIHRRTKRLVSVSFALHLNKSLLYNNPATTVDDLEKIILKIPYEQKRVGPCVLDTDIEALKEKYNMPQGKTVFLNPYTGGWAVKEIPSRFYVELVKQLKEKGYTPITVLGFADQQPVEGTQGIVATLAQAWHLAKWGGWMIGTRSGFFDFIQFSGCNLVILYDPGYKEKDIYSLVKKQEVAHTSEYVWNSQTEKQLIDRILAELAARDAANDCRTVRISS